MNNQNALLRHIIGWALFIAYTLAGQYVNGGGVSVFSFTILIVQLAQFYFCYAVIFPRFLKKEKAFELAAGIIAALALFIALRYLIEEVSAPHLFGTQNYNEGTTAVAYILHNLFWGLPCIAISTIVWSSEQAFKRQQESKNQHEAAIQAELAFLKTRVEPYFLNNAFNYLNTLATPVSNELTNAIIRLSQYLNHSLSADGFTSLQQEVDHLENYITIYRLQFENSFYADLKAEGNLANNRLAALLLMPFVQNAFKHGVVNDAQRPVRIHLKVIGNRLMFTVSNKINRQQKAYSSGMDLANVRRRLELIYPGKHDLLISENGQTYKVTLSVEL